MKHRNTSNRFKLPKVSRPSVPHAVRRRLPRRKRSASPLEILSELPRITNETVAEHREEILGSARRFIYPLQHSRDRIIKVSATLFVAAIVTFFAYCGLALYKFQSSSTFIYEVTRVIPFPIAVSGGQFIAYENYLFELRHLIHYYETQQNEDFSNESGGRHMTQLKRDSLQKVIDDAYVKRLAAKNKIAVSNREVSDQIALVKSQNRLGSNDQMLSDVLKQFWNWSIDDFERELKSQLLSQKVASGLDTATQARASNALAEIKSGADFGAVAARVSEDANTKDKGGLYPTAIGKTSRDVPPQVVDAMLRLSPGQISAIIDTGTTLEIIKSTQVTGDKVQGAHISFKLQDISVYLAPLKDQQKVQRLIKI